MGDEVESPGRPPPPQLRTGHRDPCVVDTAPLSSLVQSFVEGWLEKRPSLGGMKHGRGYLLAKGMVEPVGPYEWLSAETGLSQSRLRAVRAGRYPTTELRVADAIVASIGEPGMFTDGTLTVRANPYAAADAVAEAMPYWDGSGEPPSTCSTVSSPTSAGTSGSDGGGCGDGSGLSGSGSSV